MERHEFEITVTVEVFASSADAALELAKADAASIVSDTCPQAGFKTTAFDVRVSQAKKGTGSQSVSARGRFDVG